MKTSAFEKGTPMVPRACLIALVLFAMQSLAACGFTGGLSSDNVPEGERCNPYLSHNDCASGLVCAGYPPAAVSIPFCPETYCCAADSNGNITSSHPNCQPGCNGGAAAICGANMMSNVDACAFAGIATATTPAPSGGDSGTQ